MNQKRVAENFIPELTDANALMRAILNEKDLAEFLQKHREYEYECERESMAVSHNAQILMKAQIRHDYSDHQETSGLIREPKPKTNLKNIIGHYIQKAQGGFNCEVHNSTRI